MDPVFTPLDATFGAVVSHVDLKKLSSETWQSLNRAFNKYGLLIFPKQHLSIDEQAVFAARFGEIEELTSIEGLKSVPLTNMRQDGGVIDENDDMSLILNGNEEWHTDSSYMPVSAKASVLSAHVIPVDGGRTGFTDMRAAYESLDETIKEQIEGLSAYHSLYHSQNKVGHEAKAGQLEGVISGLNSHQIPLRPLVKVHPETGKKSLFVGRHAYGIPGLSEAESEKLLIDLIEFSCQKPRVYFHRWNVGDLLIWDNRCMLHKAGTFDRSEPRLMIHTRIAGDPQSESGVEVA